MTRRLKLTLLSLLSFWTIACGANATAPSIDAIASITLSQTAATVARNGTLQLTAHATTQAGTTTDVTSVGTWTSSNTSVATVTNGLVTVVGPGIAEIKVANADRSATAVITGRRTTRISGAFQLTDANGSKTITGAMTWYLDGAARQSQGASDPVHGGAASVSMPAGASAVSPGTHEIRLALILQFGAESTIVAEAETFAVSDADTGEALGTISFARQQKLVRASPAPGQLSDDAFAWTIDVPMFDR